VVTKAEAPLTEGGRSTAVSFNTRLPVLAVEGGSVTVATPSGERGVLAASDVEIVGPGQRPPTGGDLVHSAEMFAGLPYLWAGTSASGFDCSGFTSTVYGRHGVVIPRDANDQSTRGTPVDRSRLEPGDLLFYASDGGRGEIHHVSMYVGNGLMIQSPATGRTVETVAVDTSDYAREFWGARRYLPGSGS
jgi:cell wall-associated NlpC family hydrolase